VKGGVRVIIAGVALTTAIAGYASQPGEPQAEASVEAVPAWVGQLEQMIEKGQGKEARALLDTQLANEERPWAVAVLHRYRAVADMLLGDREAFKNDVAFALKLSPDPVQHLPAFVEMGTMFDPGVALASLKRLAAIDPEQARDLDEMVVGRLLGAFKQGHLDDQYEDLVLVLADISYGGILSRDDIQLEAATILIGRGQLDPALVHAEKISGRSGLIDILTDRRFERIWGRLEQSVGDRMETIAQVNLVKAKAQFDRAPQDLEARLALMRAYKDLGMWDPADELGKAVGTTSEELTALTERTAWIVDEHARILAEAGRVDEADARRAAIVATWSDERGWVISMAINRIATLADAHHYDRALALLDSQKDQLERYSSPYAKQLVRAFRALTLAGLKRPKDAAALGDDILSHADDATSATLGALLLLGRDAEAEKLAIRWLSDPEKSGAMISFLRVSDTSKTDDPVAVELHNRFRARPAVQAAFLAKGRDLPERLRRAF